MKKFNLQKHATLFDNEHFGAPCSLETDIEESTCDLEALRKQRWIK